MTVFMKAFLRPQDISKLPGFRTEITYPERGKPITWNYVGSASISGGNESPSVSVGDTVDTIPEVLREQIIRVAGSDNFTSNPRRERGRYELGGATLKLEITNDRQPHYHVQFEGPTPEACRDILEAVKMGTIRPTHSYEHPQGGNSIAQLEFNLRTRDEQNMLLGDANTRLTVENKKLLDKVHDLRTMLLALVQAALNVQAKRHSWFGSRARWEALDLEICKAKKVFQQT